MSKDCNDFIESQTKSSDTIRQLYFNGKYQKAIKKVRRDLEAFKKFHRNNESLDYCRIKLDSLEIYKNYQGYANTASLGNFDEGAWYLLRAQEILIQKELEKPRIIVKDEISQENLVNSNLRNQLNYALCEVFFRYDSLNVIDNSNKAILEIQRDFEEICEISEFSMEKIKIKRDAFENEKSLKKVAIIDGLLVQFLFAATNNINYQISDSLVRITDVRLERTRVVRDDQGKRVEEKKFVKSKNIVTKDFQDLKGMLEKIDAVVNIFLKDEDKEEYESLKTKEQLAKYRKDNENLLNIVAIYYLSSITLELLDQLSELAEKSRNQEEISVNDILDEFRSGKAYRDFFDSQEDLGLEAYYNYSINATKNEILIKTVLGKYQEDISNYNPSIEDLASVNNYIQEKVNLQTLLQITKNRGLNESQRKNLNYLLELNELKTLTDSRIAYDNSVLFNKIFVSLSICSFLFLLYSISVNRKKIAISEAEKINAREQKNDLENSLQILIQDTNHLVVNLLDAHVTFDGTILRDVNEIHIERDNLFYKKAYMAVLLIWVRAYNTGFLLNNLIDDQRYFDGISKNQHAIISKGKNFKADIQLCIRSSIDLERDYLPNNLYELEIHEDLGNFEMANNINCSLLYRVLVELILNAKKHSNHNEKTDQKFLQLKFHGKDIDRSIRSKRIIINISLQDNFLVGEFSNPIGYESWDSHGNKEIKIISRIEELKSDLFQWTTKVEKGIFLIRFKSKLENFIV